MSLLYRYRAVALAGPSRGTVARGELVGETPAEVRMKLRSAGLQALEVAPLPRRDRPRFAFVASLSDTWERYVRTRRRARKEEIFDGLATMLDAGVPIVEALDTLSQGDSACEQSTRRMLIQVRDDLRGGSSLAKALSKERGWFEPVEVALLEAGEHSGSLAATLRAVADRQQRKSAVAQKVVSALAYPAIVGGVGLCVWLFLSTKTLPEFVRILEDGQVEVPGLTRGVMAVGQFVLRDGLLVLAGLAALLLVAVAANRRLAKTGSPWARRLRGIGGTVLRRLRLARFAGQIAELLDHGVPLVEGLRVVAPSVGNAHFAEQLRQSASEIERGRSFSETLRDEAWFPTEFRRLVELGEASGELASLLTRLGERLERGAQRRIDSLTALLEPAVILALAALIGVVVMAAVLPITRLQELV